MRNTDTTTALTDCTCCLFIFLFRLFFHHFLHRLHNTQRALRFANYAVYTILYTHVYIVHSTLDTVGLTRKMCVDMLFDVNAGARACVFCCVYLYFYTVASSKCMFGVSVVRRAVVHTRNAHSTHALAQNTTVLKAAPHAAARAEKSCVTLRGGSGGGRLRI